MNIKKIGRSVVRFAKNNPTIALGAVAIVAPGLARKAAPIVVAALAKGKGA